MTSPPDPDLDRFSEELRAFIAPTPRARKPLAMFLQQASLEIPGGAAVLDVGAGTAPYRELFAHTRYVTCDWESSIYDEQVDIRASASDIPVDGDSFDVVVCTQVLEHVPEPRVVLAEIHRVLRPGGRLLLTAPLVWFLHEEPYDFYRYTSHGLRFLLESSGFGDIDVQPLGDAFSSLAELVANLGFMTGVDSDPSDQDRAAIARSMKHLAEVIGSFSGYDTRRLLPLDYAVTARRPAPVIAAPPVDRRRGGMRRLLPRRARSE